MYALIVALFLSAGVPYAAAQPGAVTPKVDRKGAVDSPLLKRYEGSFIVGYERKSYEEVTLPLSRLEKVPGDRRVGLNNAAWEPKNRKTASGSYTRLVYLIPENRSPLEVLRNYQDEIKAGGGTILFECQGSECGGDPQRSLSGGGGDISLSMYLYAPDRFADPYGSPAHCVQQSRISEQRYALGEIPDSNAHVSVLTYKVVDPHVSCVPFNGRTIAVVDIIEGKAREQRMVTVSSTEMAQKIATTGRIALYGIHFDFNKTDIKSESSPTLQEIAKLMKDNGQLKLLVVGHTDNVGSLSFNTDLSQRRATAVVNDLVSRHGIAKERLTPLGVSFASPVAPNDTEQGRARNRRVELVRN